MVVCPRCGSNVQKRKLLVLTNHNAITCQVCGSRLRVKNKIVNSAIGGAGGGLGAVIIFFFAMLWIVTGNLAYLGLLIIIFAALLLIAWLLVIKYVKVELETPQSNPQPPASVSSN